MSTAGDYRQVRNWLPAETTSKPVEIGERAKVCSERPCSLGLLRVGYTGGALQEPVDAVVQVADNGTSIGPLDLPFMLVGEQPFVVLLTPSAASINPISVTLSVVPVGAPSDRLYATRSIVAVINQVIPLPQWVRGVSVLLNGSFQFRDRAAVPLCAVSTGAHDRPASAADIIVTAAGTVTFYY
jgi:hypothetical protein